MKHGKQIRILGLSLLMLTALGLGACDRNPTANNETNTGEGLSQSEPAQNAASNRNEENSTMTDRSPASTRTGNELPSDECPPGLSAQECRARTR